MVREISWWVCLQTCRRNF